MILEIGVSLVVVAVVASAAAVDIVRKNTEYSNDDPNWRTKSSFQDWHIANDQEYCEIQLVFGV